MRLKYFTLGIIILLCARSAHAAQTIDPREYVDWSKCEYPYNQLVKLRADNSVCTAQFVAPDIVATAMHCIASRKTGKLKKRIRLQNCHGNWFPATIIANADAQDFLNIKPLSRNDWALLRVDDPQYYSQAYFNIDSEQTKPQPIEIANTSATGYTFQYDNNKYPGFIGTSAGWGALPILSDADVMRIKYELKKLVAEQNNGMQYDVNGGVAALYANGYFDKITSDDSNKLKIHKNCKMFPDFAPYNLEPENQSTCMIWAGNSGGAFYTESDNTLHGVASTSIYMLPNKNIHDNKSLVSNYAPTRKIYQLTGRYSNPQPQQQPENPSNPQSQPAPPQQPKVPQQQTTPQPQQPQQPEEPQQQLNPQNQQPQQPEEDTDISEDDINNLGNNIDNDLQNIDDMSDYDFLILLGNIIDYNQLRKEYEAAKAREQSVPNKLLGGLTMAATGVGGQMLATGLAEQRADEAAERDMRAYLATFRCDYGQGRNITGGETNIQLPGGNELLQFVTEYKQLAASLKSDKEALGMMPGIESEIISDSAATGLYDDVSIGTQKGAFTSLSRALLDENSDDAKAWAEQTSAAHKQKNTGLTVAAAGAIGGMVGNIVINHDKDADTTNAQPENNTSNKQPSKNTDETIFSDCDKNDCEFDFNINPDIDTSDINDENIFMANLASYTLPANGKKTGTPTTQAVPVSFATAQSDFSKINDNLFAKAFNQALTTQLRKSGKTLDSSKLKDQGGTFLYQAKQHNLNPFVSSAIAFYESTYGTSPAARNKNNIAGLMSGGKTVTYNSVPDSIAAQARSLRNFYIDKRGNTEINNMTYDGGTTKWKKDVTSITKLLYKTYNDLASNPTQ